MGKILPQFLLRWLIDTVAVFAAASVVPGIRYDGWRPLLFASLMLGIVNTFVRPVLMLFTLPLVFLTLGLFIFVINALMLLLVEQIVPYGFYVDGLWAAMGGALVITLVSVVLEKLTGRNNARIELRRGRGRPGHRGPPDGGGPVIDV